MLRKKIIIDFDSERISVMENGVLVKHCPSAVVRKATEAPVAICYGESAVKKKNALSEGEIFSQPFKCGRVTDIPGAQALIKAIIQDVFGKARFVTVYVLVSGGLSAADKSVIEQAVLGAGAAKSVIVPRPKIISRLLEINSLYSALYMDADITEFILASDGNIRNALSIDVSTTALAEQLRSWLLSVAKLSLSVESSLEIAQKSCSLFESDATKITAKGKDAITLNEKSMYFTAREAYPVTEKIYSIVCDLIKAALLDEEREFSLAAAQSGILFMGSGVRICGFEEFIYHKLGLSGIILDDCSVLLSLTHRLSEDMPEFFENDEE